MYVLSLKKSRNPPKHSQQIISGQGQRQSTFVVDCLSLFMCKSNSNTICVEVVYVTSVQLAAKWFSTSVQVGRKWGFRLPTNLVGSELLYSRQVVGKLVLKILPMLDRIFLPVDISLENVLTGKENFFATVDFRSL